MNLTGLPYIVKKKYAARCAFVFTREYHNSLHCARQRSLVFHQEVVCRLYILWNWNEYFIFRLHKVVVRQRYFYSLPPFWWHFHIIARLEEDSRYLCCFTHERVQWEPVAATFSMLFISKKCYEEKKSMNEKKGGSHPLCCLPPTAFNKWTMQGAFSHRAVFSFIMCCLFSHKVIGIKNVRGSLL